MICNYSLEVCSNNRSREHTVKIHMTLWFKKVVHEYVEFHYTSYRLKHTCDTEIRFKCCLMRTYQINSSP